MNRCELKSGMENSWIHENRYSNPHETNRHIGNDKENIEEQSEGKVQEMRSENRNQSNRLNPEKEMENDETM